MLDYIVFHFALLTAAFFKKFFYLTVLFLYQSIQVMQYVITADYLFI